MYIYIYIYIYVYRSLSLSIHIYIYTYDIQDIQSIVFATDQDGISARQEVRFKVNPDGQPRTIVIPVGKHPRWAGARITRVRLDLIHGAPSASIVLQSVHLR